MAGFGSALMCALFDRREFALPKRYDAAQGPLAENRDGR